MYLEHRKFGNVQTTVQVQKKNKQTKTNKPKTIRNTFILKIQVTKEKTRKLSHRQYILSASHVNTRFPNEDAISPKASELKALSYLYYDKNNRTHNQIFIKDVQYRKHFENGNMQLTLMSFAKSEAQQHEIFVQYLLRNKIYKSENKKKNMYQLNDTPHIHWRESLHLMVIKLMPCPLYRNNI